MDIQEIREIAKSGGCFIIKDDIYTAQELISIALCGATLIIQNSKNLSSLECQQIAKANPGKVFFEI